MKNHDLTYYYKDSLKSERLITHFLNLNYIKDWSDFFKEKEATKYFLPFDFNTNEEIAEYWIKTQIKRYKENEYGLQAILDIETNEFIGQCGLLTQEVDDKKELEVGYHVMKKHWGKGFAPEAARLFIDFAFENNFTKSIISIIHKDNIKSQKVALKIGLTKEKETNWKGMDVYIYRIER